MNFWDQLSLVLIAKAFSTTLTNQEYRDFYFLVGIKHYLPTFIMGKAIGDLEIFLSIILHLQNVSTIYQEMERDGEHIQKKSLSINTLAGILEFCPKII